MVNFAPEHGGERVLYLAALAKLFGFGSGGIAGTLTPTEMALLFSWLLTCSLPAQRRPPVGLDAWLIAQARHTLPDF
jgi:hypothetical protein